MSRALPLLLCSVGGLIVVISTAAGWVSREEIRSVGGIEVGEAVSVSGTEIAPVLLVLGLVGFGGGFLLAVLPVVIRRVLGLGAVGVGMAAAVTAIMAGFVQLDLAGGERTPAAAFAAIGGLVVAAGGYVATRARQPRPSGSRFDVEAQNRHSDAEWDLAVDDERS